MPATDPGGAQPSWSGFPLIVLAREGQKQIGLPDDFALHTTLVERPLRMVTLKSVVDTALRHRRRQYELRVCSRIWNAPRRSWS